MKLKKLFNSNYLKLIAIIAMTIDHSSDLLFPGFPLQSGFLFLRKQGLCIGIIRLIVYGNTNICL